MNLSNSEKRDIIKLIEIGQNLPEKYRFLLFDQSKQVELKWNGKSDQITNTVLPFQIIEQVDEPRTEDIKFAQGSLDFASGRQLTGWTNKLIWGDNKYILSSLKSGPMRREIEEQGGIKLIYIDPPFDVGADFSINVGIGEDNNYEKQPNVLEHIAYRDTWGLGQDSFLSMIYERLILMKDLLADDGSIFVHCDWRLNSHLRIVMNEIFGTDQFRNEIVWCYSGPGKNERGFVKKHDNIIYYSKSHLHKHNIQRIKHKSGVHNTGKFLGKVNEVEGLKEKLELSGKRVEDWWTDIFTADRVRTERVGYPTQKPENLLRRIIDASTKEGDLVADFFVGSGTTAATAEKMGRKWICTDLGKFAIHTTRKRMIAVQRKLKKEKKDWRAFELLNLGKYQREYFLEGATSNQSEIEVQNNKIKLNEYENLIFEAYKAQKIEGFKTLHGRKGDNFVSLGPVNQPLSRNHIEEIISECIINKIISVDVLGFEYEMGLFPTIQEEAKSKGLRLTYKQIPIEIFDKRAVERGEVVFHDVAYIDFKTHINKKNVSIELTDFAVFYNEENFRVNDELGKNKSKVFIERGQIVERHKDKNGVISEKIITKNWHDWIDYWSVDFNYESKKEIIKVFNEKNNIEEKWTGNYIFENEWQAFRSKGSNNKLELKSSEMEIIGNRTKIAVKVIDIFGNDTMKIMEMKL